MKINLPVCSLVVQFFEASTRRVVVKDEAAVGDADDEGAARLNVVSDPTPAIVQRALNDVSVAHPAIVT